MLPPPENFLKFYAEIINFRAKFSLGYKMHPVIRGRDGHLHASPLNSSMSSVSFYFSPQVLETMLLKL